MRAKAGLAAVSTLLSPALAEAAVAWPCRRRRLTGPSGRPAQTPAGTIL